MNTCLETVIIAMAITAVVMLVLAVLAALYYLQRSATVLHHWTYHTARHRQLVFFYRRCDCGALETQYAGPMGDGEWHSVTKPGMWQWERDAVSRAIRNAEQSKRAKVARGEPLGVIVDERV